MLTTINRLWYGNIVTASAVMELQNSITIGGQTASYMAVSLCPVGGSVCPSVSERLPRSFPIVRVLNHWTPIFKNMCCGMLLNLTIGVKTMTQLVKVNKNNTITTTSLILAETFGKRHDAVLRKIESLEIPHDFTHHNFVVSEYIDITGRRLKSYEITRDGFTLLAMGFTGKKAIQFKLAYINAFNEMEHALLQRQGSLPFEPVSLAASDFIHNKKAMKEISRLVKRCCTVSIREYFRNVFKTKICKVTLEELVTHSCTVAIHEAFSEIFKAESITLEFNKNNKNSKELNVIAEAIINYGHSEYKKGKIEGILTSMLDEKYKDVSKKIAV